MTRSMALGLALLYASAYFLPLLGAIQIYFVPSLPHYVLFPSLVAAVVLAPIILLLGRALRTRPPSRMKSLIGWIAMSALTFIALLSALTAADYSLGNLIVKLLSPGSLPSTVRALKVGLVAGLLALSGIFLLVLRSRWLSVLRFLSTLGYAFAILAIARTYPQHTDGVAVRGAADEPAVIPASGNALHPVKRRVIWVIFDELDYGLTLGAEPGWVSRTLPNLQRLSREALSAEQAYPPAKDTEASLPAMLEGVAIENVRIDSSATLWLTKPDHTEQPFSQDGTVFARLPNGAGAAGLLGYYHPYCRILPAVGMCHSSYLGNAGRWFDALLVFGEPAMSLARWLPGSPPVPAVLLDLFDPMYRATREISQLLPVYLGRQDQELTFFHLSVPHYPATYAQRELGLPVTADERRSYQDNLLLVDRLVGEIEAAVRRTQRDTLLVVSSDHWLRIESPTTARPVPFLVWHVGESQGIRLTEPISTAHTADLVLRFLQGTLESQADIAQWWQMQPFSPSWIPNNFRY